jgi:hypothetical protein
MKVNILQKDIALENVPSGNTVFAKNMVYSEKYGSVSNEDGFDLLYTHNKKYIGGYSANKEEVFFSGEGSTSEIGIFKNNVYTKILQSSVLNFSRANPIEVIGFYNAKNELIVIWWDGNFTTSNKPRILNLSCLPFAVNPDKTPVNNTDLIVLDLHQDNPSGVLDIEITDSGSIEAGAYYPVFAYKLSDGSYTNFSHPFHPIYINDDSSKLPFEEIDGVVGGTIVNKSILFKFTELLTAYNNIAVALIKKVNGQTSAISLGETRIDNSGSANIVFSDINSTSDINLESILIDSPIYTRVQAGTILENQLNLLNLSVQSKPEIQQYVNNIDVKWVLEDGGSLTDFPTSNKDSEYTFYNKSFKSGETYALYLVAKVKDVGLVAYHIPAKGKTGNSRSVLINGINFGPGISLQDVQDTIGGPGNNINVDEGLMVNNEAEVFHIFNTAQSDNKMGVFINKNETYSDSDCWLVYDADGAVIDTLKNTAVTHHTFPSWQRLLDFNTNNNLYKINDVSKLTLLASNMFDSSISGSSPSGLVPLNTNTTSITGTWDSSGTEFTATENMSFYLRILYLLVNAPSDSSPSGLLVISRFLGTSLLEKIVHKVYDGTTFFQDEIHEEIKLNQGETLKILFVTNAPCEGLIETFIINKQLADCDIISKKLGIKLSNVNIPLEFRSQIEWWTLGYAERNNINITRSGQVLMIPDTRQVFEMIETTDPLIISDNAIIGYGIAGYDNIATEAFRTHNFDHLYYKDNIKVDFIDGNLKIGTANNYDFHNYITPFTNSNKIVKSVKSSYLVPENLISENNRIGEFHHKLKLNTSSDFGCSKYQFLMADLCHFRKDLYLNFEKQSVIICDNRIPVNSTESPNIYQGDVFINIQGIGVSLISDKKVGDQLFYLLGVGVNKGFTNKIQDNLLYICESTSNLGFRYNDSTDASKYYPRNISKQISGIFKQTDEEKALHEIGTISQGLLYNIDYSSINNIKEIQIFQCLENCESEITRFPVRIARSPKIADESIYNSWRRFRPNDYYDGLPKDKGEGWVLTTFNRSLLIQLQEALYIALPKDVIQSDAVYAYLGTGDLFDRLPEEVVPDGNGYVGCISKWATGVCKHGYFVWDSVQGKVFIFNGKIEEISNHGLKHYLISVSNISNELDNPFNNRGLVIGYDELYNRLLITKIYRIENVVFNTLSQTLSYSFDLQGWVCTHHNYYPSAYFYPRNRLLSIDNNVATNSFKLYRHNSNTAICSFYSSIKYDAHVDIVFNVNNNANWDSIQWISEFITSVGKTYENTITGVMVYTNYHSTGVVVLNKHINLTKPTNNTRRKNYVWSFNKLRDISIDKNISPVNGQGAVNVGNVNTNTPFFRKGYFISPFIVVRLIIDNTINNKIHINDVDAQYTKT